MSKLKFTKMFHCTLTKHRLIAILFFVAKRKAKNEFQLFYRILVLRWRKRWNDLFGYRFSVLYYFNSENLDLDYFLNLDFQNYQNVVILYKFFQRTVRWLCKNILNEKLIMIICQYDDEIGKQKINKISKQKILFDHLYQNVGWFCPAEGSLQKKKCFVGC